MTMARIMRFLDSAHKIEEVVRPVIISRLIRPVLENVEKLNVSSIAKNTIKLPSVEIASFLNLFALGKHAIALCAALDKYNVWEHLTPQENMFVMLGLFVGSSSAAYHISTYDDIENMERASAITSLGIFAYIGAREIVEKAIKRIENQQHLGMGMRQD